jgi:predicted porin
MKKHLIAAAALATLSTAAFAQSSVTAYGFIDAGILTTNNAGNGKSATMATAGQWFPSMIGFTGTEDLGGGLKANFNLQGSLWNQTGGAGDAASGAAGAATNLFGRYATVGLSGGFGKIDLGRQIDILFLQSFVNGVIPTHTNSLAVNGLLTYGATGSTANVATAGAFINNAIGYVSPTVNGFKLQAQTSLGGQAGDSAKNATSAAILNYDAGSLSLNAGYEVQNDSLGGLAGHKSLLGAKYTVGNVLLASQYHTYKASSAASSTVDAKGYELGAGYQLNPKTLVAVNYESFKNDLTGTKPSIVSLKAKYDLSKRTYLYATAAKYDKEAAAAIKQGYNESTTGSTTSSATNLGLGIVHGF